jgi:hypothetical protein
MTMGRLPPDSKRYAELVYEAKEVWHRRQARMSFIRKLEVLDRMRSSADVSFNWEPVDSKE